MKYIRGVIIYQLVNYESPEAVARRWSVKKVLLKISQNSQENTCARVSFFSSFTKKRLMHRCVPVNFAKFFRTPFL